MRVIYDPWTTQFDPGANRATRTPFAGNRIPQNRFDPTSQRILKDLWLPNGPGDDLTGLNNFKKAFQRYHRYWNFSDRADWNINDSWKVFGRYSRFLNDYQPQNYANSKAAPINGGIMASPWYESYISNLDHLYYPQMNVSGAGASSSAWRATTPPTASFRTCPSRMC